MRALLALALLAVCACSCAHRPSAGQWVPADGEYPDAHGALHRCVDSGSCDGLADWCSSRGGRDCERTERLCREHCATQEAAR